MNADEIVTALRTCNKPRGHRCSECPVFSRYEHRICKATVDRSAADLIESLQSQLTESQRRQKAAVEDMKHIANKIEKCHYKLGDGEEDVSSLHLGRCDVCTKICHEDKPCKFEWRGPQKG
jgi:hypothetical protein